MDTVWSCLNLGCVAVVVGAIWVFIFGDRCMFFLVLKKPSTGIILSKLLPYNQKSTSAQLTLVSNSFFSGFFVVLLVPSDIVGNNT